MNRRTFVLGLLTALGGAALAAAAPVPGRYIVELNTEPVAAHAGRLKEKAGLHSAAATAHRDRIHAEQLRLRPQLESRSAQVIETLDTVLNAFIVNVPDGQAAALANLPGVRRIRPVREYKLLLDRTVLLHKVTDAWAQIGGPEQAGRGIKVAIIDTGVEATHPGFQDSSLTVPNGFPKTNTASDQAYTNNKIIVARSYVSLLPARDPDRSARDHVGHGTALAMAVAGVRNSGPQATITGLAPNAFIGNYKVFGTPGYNDSASEDAVLKAIDDAVKDGMDIINLSLGPPADGTPRLAEDPGVAAVENASAAGVIVVAAAGNDGPDPNTMGSPATAPSVIAAGAMQNERTFCVCAEVTGRDLLYHDFGQFEPASNSLTAPTASGPLADVSKLDSSGLACDPLPAGSLSGQIALIQRGTCNFSVKLDNAQNAGAIAALIYEDAPRDYDLFTMNQQSNTLPAAMITDTDALALLKILGQQTPLTATLHFQKEQARLNAGVLASFSSRGPNVDGGIKPDLLAVGEGFYTATQTLDANGEMYDESGYITVDGTSFSSPTVAGAAALLKAARPGLTVAQYRSLLINTAAPAQARVGTPASVQQAGAGILDVSAALRSTVTAEPASLSFGSGSGDVQLSRGLRLTNVRSTPDTYFLAISPATGSAVPTLNEVAVSLAPGASTTVPVSFAATGLAAGAYEGLIRISSTSTGQEIRVPYWYGVSSDTAQSISVLYNETYGYAGTSISDAITFRVLDAAGLPITSLTPAVTVADGGGRVVRLRSYNSEYPGVYGITVRLGTSAGMNSFQISAGGITRIVKLLGY